MQDLKSFSGFGHNISTSAVLYGGEKGFCFPIAKVAKYLAEGREYDTRFFAGAMIAAWNQETR